MAICKECNTLAPPHCFRGRCRTHTNEICSKCWDKLALDRMGKSLVSYVSCKQCGETLNEYRFGLRMSAKISQEYVLSKYWLSVELNKQQRKREMEQQKPIQDAIAQDEELEDFVVVDRTDIADAGYCEANGGIKGRDDQACMVM
ncbi:hypothetical protein CKM354_000909100 [Cercospora kikuchii]|uniref:Uncharacterized protein n=1 Tax=Cercospora kikuchii TaxID=84275 RepID=A0A9P3FK46_9PEZI|nr:uncharacterized protein CKM354_000909100 [Cercospora kikuchii]GIZ45945.1 hypothetical protein CKM354_000909100 [Cercospora kikuchii]